MPSCRPVSGPQAPDASLSLDAALLLSLDAAFSLSCVAHLSLDAALLLSPVLLLSLDFVALLSLVVGLLSRVVDLLSSSSSGSDLNRAVRPRVYASGLPLSTVCDSREILVIAGFGS